MKKEKDIKKIALISGALLLVFFGLALGVRRLIKSARIAQMEESLASLKSDSREKEVLEYIEKARKAGLSYFQVRNNIIQVGFSEEEVKRIFDIRDTKDLS